jgi:hypothetical protein
MNLGEIKTIPNSAKKHLAELDSYEAIYLTKNEETDFYLFTEVELRKGLQRARLQPEEEAQNPMSLDLTKGIYLLWAIAGFILGAIIL